MAILDVKLPQLDGYQICHRLRAESETASLPILILTARDQLADRVAGFEVGADAYMVKPIHFGRLVHHVDVLPSRPSHQAGFAFPHSSLPEARKGGICEIRI